MCVGCIAVCVNHCTFSQPGYGVHVCNNDNIHCNPALREGRCHFHAVNECTEHRKLNIDLSYITFTVSPSVLFLGILVMQLFHISRGHPLPACLLHVVHCRGEWDRWWHIVADLCTNPYNIPHKAISVQFTRDCQPFHHQFKDSTHQGTQFYMCKTTACTTVAVQICYTSHKYGYNIHTYIRTYGEHTRAYS